MAPPSMPGAVGGGYVSGAIPADALLIIIGALLGYFGVDMLRPGRAEAAVPAATEKLDVRAAVITGAVIGTLGGLVGLILGSLRMPALLRYVGETPARA